MLKQFLGWVPHQYLSPFLSTKHHTQVPPTTSSKNASKIKARPIFGTQCGARRRVIYDEQDYEHNNIEIAILESYTKSVQNEVLFVTALVDDRELQLLIFKGFSSCLSSKTPQDPSRSVIPATAVIKSIDRIRGPFDPSDIKYIEKGLTFDEFKNSLR
ncbi:uncharacterized protein [Primulina huaijiensis]|uniref:uncharacterized protein n=1 Tax=Primulina huaijiensis TaxID=1492673 RepID=UPI003CC6F03E